MVEQSLRLVFLGTKDFAVPTFERLADSSHPLVALITQPDRPQGRKQELIPARIKLAAQTRGIPVHQPENINSPEAVMLLRSLKPDLLVTAAYGQILSPEVLSVARLGGINLHGSILPKYRGAAPVAWAILEGESETGVTVIQMSPKLDAGGMIGVVRTKIDPNETTGELETRLGVLGAPLMHDVVDRLASGKVELMPQDPALATKAPKLKKDSGRIDWSKPAHHIHNLVRAMQPWPTAVTTWHPATAKRTPLPLIIHKTKPTEDCGRPGRVIEASDGRFVIGAGQGSIQILLLQVPGKRVVEASEFLRGYPVAIDDVLGTD